VHELQKELQSQSFNKPKNSAGQVTRDAFASVLESIASVFRQRRAANTDDCPAEMELPAYNTPANTSNQLYGEESGPRSLYPLLCVDEGSSRHAFYQQSINDINRDRALFKLVRSQYFRLRNSKRWLTIKSMNRLSLSQVGPSIAQLHCKDS
jgi:hypothetical protein